jgi:hypothetical protein
MKTEGLVALCVNGAVITTMDEIIPLPEVEVVKTIMAWTYEGELGGRTPLVVAVVERV